VKIGLVGLPGCGKSTVFSALTGIAVETGYAAGSGKANLGVVKVPDPRVDALAALYAPKKITYAEVTFTDLANTGATQGLDRPTLNAMRDVDALCQVLRGFPNELGEPPDPVGELAELETETILADLEIVEQRVERLRKDRSDPGELELQERIQSQLESEKPLRAMELSEAEEKRISGYAFLTRKPLLLVLNVAEAAVTEPLPADLQQAADDRGLGLVLLSALVEMDIAQMETAEQREFLESLGLEEPASHRFIRAAYTLIDLISMLTAGPDECRAWPVRRDTPAPQAAGKIHSDIERGFIRAEVTRWEDLEELGSEARCREVGKLRVEGKEYVVKDGDVVNFRFNV
jgi:GTP-binding protein YchF